MLVFPSLSPRVCSNSCPSSPWCYHLILCCPFPFYLQSFPALRSFSSWLSVSGGQSTGASASPSVLPVNIQGWFPFKLTGLTSWQSKGLSRVFSSTTVQNHQSVLWCSAFFLFQLSYPYMTTCKTVVFTRQIFVGKAMYLIFNMLSRCVIAFLPRIYP